MSGRSGSSLELHETPKRAEAALASDQRFLEVVVSVARGPSLDPSRNFMVSAKVAGDLIRFDVVLNKSSQASDLTMGSAEERSLNAPSIFAMSESSAASGIPRHPLW